MKLSSQKEWKKKQHNWLEYLNPNRMNKRGNLADILLFPAIIFAMGVTLFIIYFMWTRLQTPLNDAISPTWTGSTTYFSQVRGGLQTFDSVFPFYMMGSILFILISAFFIKSHPIFFFISIFLFIIAILLGAILANVHRDAIRTNPEFASVVDDFSTTSYLINRLPIITLVVGIVTAVILFSKPTGIVGSMGAGV